MRIVQLMFSDGWGGAERLFVELCSGLAEAGHETLAVCRPGFTHGTLLKGRPSITYATVPARCNWDYWSLFTLTKLIREFSPDLIHAHLARASWMAGMVGAKLDTPTVSTTHNSIKGKYISNISYFTTITDELTNHIQKQGVAENCIRKIPNFSLIKPLDNINNVRHDPLVFIALGRFVHKKGFDVLLKAFKNYTNGESPPAKLIIAGSGPLEQELHHQADRLDIRNLVEFSGWVNDVSAFFDRGDIFVLPSRDEPFGIVLLEAMARGKPIIATDVSGPRDFLDQETVFFVQPGDSDGLSRTMRIATESPALCHNKAQHALQRFRSEYTREAVLPRFIDFYTDIVKRSN